MERRVSATSAETDTSASTPPLGGKCGSCGKGHFPQRARCPWCWSEAIEPLPIAGPGRIDTFTVVRKGPRDKSVPYGLVWATFPEGVRIFGVVRSGLEEALTVGGPVELRSNDDGEPPFYVEPMEQP